MANEMIAECEAMLKELIGDKRSGEEAGAADVEAVAEPVVLKPGTYLHEPDNPDYLYCVHNQLPHYKYLFNMLTGGRWDTMDDMERVGSEWHLKPNSRLKVITPAEALAKMKAYHKL